MKFPTVTVTLVSLALVVVIWQQSQDQQDTIDPSRFANLAANPVERGTVVDWVVTQVPALCQEATSQADGSEAVSQCVERSERRSSNCRRALYDHFPALISSEAVFRDLTITAMDCLVPQSERLTSAH